MRGDVAAVKAAVEAGVAPSPRADLGLNVIKAIISYAGRRIALAGEDGVHGFGLTDARRRMFIAFMAAALLAAPGLVTAGPGPASSTTARADGQAARGALGPRPGTPLCGNVTGGCRGRVGRG